MNKQIKSLLLCFVMVFAIVATAVPTYAYSTETAEVELSIVPDKTTASPGDTVTYAVNIGPVRRLQSVNFTLVIPDTLEYGVGKEVDGLKDLLGADTAEYTDANKTMIIGGGGSYNCDSTTPLMKFTCTVKSSTPNGEVEIGIMDDWDIADDEWETYPNVKINTAASIVTIVSPSKPATAISLNKDTLSLVVGNSETLTATLTPANSTDKVTWTSSADSIATVDENGVVTAVTEGTATITAKANDDVSAMCVVTVEKATCKHEHKTEHPAVASTCIMLGHNQYYTCDDCGKVFKADGVTETTVEAEMLTEYGAHVQKIPATCTAKAICEVCGQAYGELADHVFTEKIEDEAHLASAGDCQTHKTYYYDCANCDLKGEETFESESYGDHKLSEVWTTENGKHFHACMVSGCTYKADEATCSGGTATCTNRAICSVCLKEYGELAPHDYKTEWNQGDENGHWHDCKNCSAHDKQQAHNPGAEATETEPQTCTECGYVIKPATGHIKHTADTSKWLYDETSHWHKCVGCDEKLDVEKHHGGNATCTAKAICEVCGQAYGELADHVFTEKIEDEAHLASAGDCQTHKTYYYDCANCDLKGEETFESESYGDHKLSEVWTTENGKHFHACMVSGCTYKADEATCSGGTATCTNRAICSVCLKEYGELAPHDYKTEWNQGDENGHWHDCKNCSAHDKQQAHNPGAEATETEPQTCTECGYVIKPATGHIKHTADTSKWLYDETSHWHKCVGCDEKLDVEKHHGGNATCTAKAICEVCAQAYGELADHIDANNDNKCDNCGKEMHEHTFSTAWSYDEAYHWHKSTCGHDDIVADKAAHTASAWIVDMEATYRNAGRMHKECVTCGYILDTAVIPASDPSQAPWWGITNRPETARKYTLTATAGHGGSITNEGTYTILADLDLTYTITPMRGYTIESVFVDGRDMGAITEYTFRNVKANHTISATFRKSFENPFIDIFESDRYYDAVAFVYENGLFKGVSAREFAPDTTMTRAMFVTVLGRLANVNADMYNTVSFDDVEAGSWYAPYVQWACDAGIVNGYGDGKFGVNDPVTVEQAAVLLARFAAYSGIQTVNYTALSGFTDAATVSDWAVAPMQFVVGNGIYTGAANALEPQSPAKRSLLAEMLYAYVMHFGE